MVNRFIQLNLMNRTVNMEILQLLFQLILDVLREDYGVSSYSEVKCLPNSWVAYYTTDEETDSKFRSKIVSTFKPNLFIFGNDEGAFV